MRASGGVIPVLILLVAGGCVTGKVLTMPGDLARPGGREAAAQAASPSVAVLDFAWDAPASREIGRDFYSVRPIVWKGEPGKAMADLVAAVLNEKGIPAIRVAGEAGAIPDAMIRVSGRVEEFHVDGKRIDLFRAENAARIVLSVSAAAPGTAEAWTTHLVSDARDQEAFLVTPDGVLTAMSGAANAAAEEAVRRLIASGRLPAPPADPGGSGAPSQGGTR